jgi:hypothetical protein
MQTIAGPLRSLYAVPFDFLKSSALVDDMRERIAAFRVTGELGAQLSRASRTICNTQRF